MPDPHSQLPTGGDISNPRPPALLLERLRKAAVYITILILNPILTLTFIALLSALRATLLATAGLTAIAIYIFILTGQIFPTGTLSSLLAYSTAGALGSIRYALALIGAWAHDAAVHRWRPSHSARLALSVASPRAGLRSDCLRLTCDLIWGPLVFMLGVRTMHDYGLRVPVGDYTGAMLVGIIGGTLYELGWVIAHAGDVRSDIYESWDDEEVDVKETTHGKDGGVRQASQPQRPSWDEQLLNWLDRAFFALAGLDGQDILSEAVYV